MKKSRFGRRGILIAAVSAAVVLVLVAAGIVSSRAGSTKTNVTCMTLKKTTLRDSVSVTGTVRSGSSAYIYTTLTAPVQKVSVSVGDSVKKGDVLAVLDTASLEADIRQQEYAAKSADSSAGLTLDKARSDYENALYQYNNEMGTELTSAKANLDSAESALSAEKQAYAAVKAAFQSGKAARKDLDAEKAKLDQAQSARDSAERAVASARNQSQQNLKAAKNAYDLAAVKNADKSGDVALEKLRRQLRQSVITAPRDGTVTQSSAAVGDVPKGALFKIEDTSDLVVDADVKEVDIAKVKAGSPVTITTDATGSDQIAGEVTRVAPAATEAAAGVSGAPTDVTFGVKIRVTGKNPGLKIGMKAKLAIVLEQKQNIFVVPYDSLVEKPNGSYVIYGAQKEGTLYKTVEVPVTAGMETDVSVEVSGPGLKEGMQVVTSPDGLSGGETILPSASSVPSVSGEE
ncbi:MAG: efflux RND transporter periplasmic adaptor subunit [Oscillospiraceae bacterium]|jgi:RND family efflux transporter MFP subunit|nr:efflux RND transporter periplasmic adaptor subunit [Oscillospiraceae bacterium]